MSDNAKQNQETIREQAFDWLIRLSETEETPALRKEFEAWLFRSPEHQTVWDGTCKMWSSMGDARAFYRQEARASHGAGRASRRHRLVAAAAGMAAVLCLAYIAAPGLLLRIEADYRTGVAETRAVMLEDGSQVLLAPGSAIASDFSAGKRTIRLLSGEAYFDVSHDEAKPFHVVSSDLDVRVLGTAFNVRVSPGGTEVGLERGAVKASGSNAVEEVLAPGDIVMLERATGKVRKEQVALEDIGAWRADRLIVVDETIGSVIDGIRRYHPSWIVVPDSRFAARRVSGIFNLADPDKALMALVAPHGGTVRAISPFARIVTGF